MNPYEKVFFNNIRRFRKKGKVLNELSFTAYEIDRDNENIIAIGLGERDGVTVILGTGICSFVVQQHQRRRIAGWGYLFDKGGSAYHIGRDAIVHCFSAYDESGEKTFLVQKNEEISGSSGPVLLKQLDNGGQKLIASYAFLVFEEAEKGDPVACAIWERNIEEMTQIIRAALKRFPEGVASIPVILAGGVTQETTLLPALMEKLGRNSARCKLQILDAQPVEGAVLRAKALWRRGIN